ncbi:MAG: hypothetical protein K8F54_06090 [Altibacter sp.]|uniref:hypothetical protein n=1 Tax=Altibacter sp. TaxID=2024823 RepID=UPI001D2A9BD4|nr:hypothetical protein [Altibacter sp.]MBZ0327157.1 hypothetical protein [Altibacter sp.]
MKRKLAALLPILFIVLSLTAQEETQESNPNSLESQFVNVIDKSNSYQEFKVISKAKLHLLRKNILDSVAALETTIETIQTEIESQKEQIASLSQDLKATQESLLLSKEKEDGIEFFGMFTKKSTYNAIMWGIILFLLAGMMFFVYRYKSSNALTKAARKKLDEVELDFDIHRQKSLEELQQLGRKLQDEINKNRKAQ